MTALLAIFLLGSFLPANLAEAAILKNAGFIQGNIWYSQDSFSEGDKVRIYSAIFNNSGSDLMGAVEFYDKETKIGSSNFSAINGRLVEVWTDWTATAGAHEIFAKIVNAKISKVGGGFEDVELPSLTTAKSAKSALPKPLPKPVVVPEPLPASGPLGESEEEAAGAAQAREPLAAATSYAKAAVAIINGAADNLAQKIESQKEAVKKEIEVLNSVVSEPNSSPAGPEIGKVESSEKNIQVEKPLKYVYLASLGALGLVLENKILLYIVLFFAGYKIIKYLFRRFYT